MRLRRALAGAGIAIALGIGTYYFAPTGTVGGKKYTPPIAGFAPLWIDAASGSTSCVRSATPISYAGALITGHVCKDGPTAYIAANMGDTILDAGETVTTQWVFRGHRKTGAQGTCDFNYPATPNLTNCVTIEPASGEKLEFNVAGGALRLCDNFISIQNATIDEYTSVPSTGTTAGYPTSATAVSIGSGDNFCGSTAPNDIYLKNISYGGPANIGGGAINTWIVGGTATSSHEIPWQLSGGGNNGVIPAVNHDGIVGVFFEGYNMVNVSPGHAECIHLDGAGDTNTVAGSWFIECMGPYAIRVESEAGGGSSSYQTNILIENNVFVGGNGRSSKLNFDCHDVGCNVSNDTVRFNTFDGGADFNYTNDREVGGFSDWTAAGNVFYGNLNPDCGQIYQEGTQWVGSYNVYTNPSTSCVIGTGDAYSATPSYTSPGSPNYNYTLNGPQTATGFVPNTKAWPPTNILGVARTGAATNAGAY